ncbi:MULTISPECIES: type IX secretion system anionic LPS delivery protein PorZ [Niastella]|uniref:T9SS type A sorting domain-containing protein n=1 Tax=Niastella soli TaxID=2821487 RepID=A0ABS3YMU1_9BACT|nr:two-component regulator propeller domain-containing protein [Niastella soli]MBO9199191.1 T9SS type A sorting domain-containing protein [Niastella soli]
MLQRILAFYCAALTIPFVSLAQFQPIGQWRDHLPYQQVTAVTYTNGKIWAATPYSLFSVEVVDNTIERWSRTNGLAETGISAMGAEPNGQRVVIAYNNSNIDVLVEDKLININSLKNASIAGDKTVKTVYIDQQLAYLATGIGIVVINLDKYEIKDTYIIGNGGSKVAVNAITSNGNTVYAATSEGLKKAPANANLADFRNWQLVSGSNGLPAGNVQALASIQNNVVAVRNDSLWLQTGNAWSLLYRDGWTIRNCTVSNNKILLSETNNNTGRIVVLTATGTTDQTILDAQLTAAPRQAIIYQNEYYIADTLAGLSNYSGNAFHRLLPDAPPAIATGSMQALHNTIWATAGAVNTNWEALNNKNGLFSFTDNTWNYFNGSRFPKLDSLTDLVAVAADPVDESVWAGSFGGGLVNIKKDNSINIFKQNSPVQPTYFNAKSYRVSGLAFDADNNLWVANYGGLNPLLVKKGDGSWLSFIIPFALPEQAVSQIVIDDNNQKWIVLPKNNGLACFNHGQNIDNPGDDQWKFFRSGKGNGNLPDNDVRCIAKDKNNFIWVGTAKGIGVIQCTQQAVTNNGCDAVLPIVQQDNFAGYLFSDEQVQTIAVDGADRKWVGTQNGVWLLSADASKIIYRFTVSNSPLLSNDVKQIAIDGKTGEVFFATAKGICSFRSTATETKETNSDVLVFPNPVPPGYTGTIAIRGVPNNAIVKITELNGRLVYQTKALGSQAIWNGKDYNGRSISSGVYLVLASDEEHQQKLVTKIVFIQK